MADGVIKGFAWKYGDNINTDIISPPAYMELSIEEASKFAMSTVDKDFAKNVRKGDAFIAEYNLGSGSSRETSPLTLKHLGIEVIVAKSFARIFYRNAINLGLIVLESQETHKIQMGDELEVDYINGQIMNLTRGENYKCSVIPEHLMKLIRAGGLVPSLKDRLKEMERS